MNSHIMKINTSNLAKQLYIIERLYQSCGYHLNFNFLILFFTLKLKIVEILNLVDLREGYLGLMAQEVTSLNTDKSQEI